MRSQKPNRYNTTLLVGEHTKRKGSVYLRLLTGAGSGQSHKNKMDMADVTAADLEFTKTVKAIRETLADCFYTWEEYPGIKSSELSEYLGQYGNLYEDTNEDLHIVYPADKRMAINLAKWLANYDMVYVKANKCIVSRSNQQAAAQLLNKLIELAA